MFRQEAERTEGLAIDVRLTLEQVDEEIPGMAEGKRDPALAPNPNITLLIKRTKNDLNSNGSRGKLGIAYGSTRWRVVQPHMSSGQLLIIK